jgi:hypothetical protein
MKSIKEMNENAIEILKMDKIIGGAAGQTDTMTVTYHRATGTTSVSNDGGDVNPNR